MPSLKERLAICAGIILLQLALTAVFFALLLGHAKGAPVPKQPPPKVLTADMMLGTWEYEWNAMRSGVITFDDSGSYVGIHIPGGSMIYSGTWTIEGGDTIVLSEYAHNLDTNGRSGPTTYRFQFAAKDYPAMVGKSNGNTHVALRRAKP